PPFGAHGLSSPPSAEAASGHYAAGAQRVDACLVITQHLAQDLVSVLTDGGRLRGTGELSVQELDGCAHEICAVCARCEPLGSMLNVRVRAQRTRVVDRRDGHIDLLAVRHPLLSRASPKYLDQRGTKLRVSQRVVGDLATRVA